MSTNTGILIIVVLLALGSLIFARAGIRSLQSARKVVFFRTRRTRTLAGWQSLGLSFVLLVFAIASAFVGEPVANRIFSSPSVLTAFSSQTPPSEQTDLPSATQTRSTAPTSLPTLPGMAPADQTQPSVGTDILTSATLPADAATQTGTATVSPLSPTRVDSAAASTSAVSTARRQAFIAALSATPTATRTPIPTWTRTPTYTPRPTWTPSPTRTPRPTLTFTHTPTETSMATASFTPTLTKTPVSTPTETATSTAAPSRTSTASRTPSFTPTIDRNTIATSIARTAQRQTFIAALSATPTATRTPIPTWTASPTRTPRPTLTLTSTSTGTFTPTASFTPTVTRTPTATSTRLPPRPGNPHQQKRLIPL